MRGGSWGVCDAPITQQSGQGQPPPETGAGTSQGFPAVHDRGRVNFLDSSAASMKRSMGVWTRSRSVTEGG